MAVPAAANASVASRKCLALLGAAGRAGLGIEIEDQVAAPIVGELDGLRPGGRDLQIRDGLADDDAHGGGLLAMDWVDGGPKGGASPSRCKRRRSPEAGYRRCAGSGRRAQPFSGSRTASRLSPSQ